MSIPASSPEVPELVRQLADGRQLRPVWRNELGGITWQLGSGQTREFVKVGPAHPEFVPARDAERMVWAGEFVPTPRVLGFGESDGLRFIHTAQLPGRTAVDPALADRGREVVAELGRALRRWHDRVPVERCPWLWDAELRLAELPSEARAELGPVPPIGDDLVVCHGDACNPNFQVDDDLHCCGYLDLGNLGIADRHADLAPALLSLGWNFAGVPFGEQPSDGRRDDLQAVFLAAYADAGTRGVRIDAAKLDWYTRLWEAG